MATPSKAVKRFAEDLPPRIEDLKDLLKGLISMKNDLPELWRNGIEQHERLLDLSIENTNKILEAFRRDVAFIQEECKGSYAQALLLGMDKAEGKLDPDKYDINTCLRTEAPKLTPKVGYEEALRRLNTLCPKLDDHNKITIRQLNGCLGFRPSEAHAVEFWVQAVPEDPSRPGIKTNGILSILDPSGTIFFFQAKEFLRALYENYYVGLIKKEIIPISNKKGKFVRFLKG